MSGLDKNRYRNKTVCFRVSPEEDQILESRIKISGLPKAEYIIQSLLKNGVTIAVGKYQSDRLSLEIRRLRELIGDLKISSNDEQIEVLLKECNALLVELHKSTSAKNDEDEMKTWHREREKK